MMKKLLSMIAVMAMLLGLATVAAAGGSNDPATWDASIFVEPENLSEAGYDGIECMDIDLGLYHLMPARNGGVGSYFRWTGTMEKMPANVEENECCFTSATSASETVIFWDGVPNFSKDLFKWWEGTTKDVYIPDSVTEIDEDAFVENSTITLHFTANNEVALAYAQSRGMLYEILPDAPEPNTSEPTTNQGTPDASIFFEEPEISVMCMDGAYLGLDHLADFQRGFTFFKWAGNMEIMPPNEDGSCLSIVPARTQAAWCAKVVFLDGVPNLSKDLFKWWEGTTKDVYIPDSVTEIDEECFVEGSNITLHFTEQNEVALAYAKSHGMRYEIMGKGYGGKVLLNTTVFQVPLDLYEFHDDPADQMRYDYLGVECYDPIEFGIYHYVRGVIDFYQWLDKMEKIPAATEENGSICSSTTIVFWNGVPNLSKNLFKWAEGTTKDVYIPDSVTEIAEDAFVMNSTITLHFTANNEVALAYAQNRGMAFEVMDGQRMPGDVDFDKSVDMKDTLSLRKSIARMPAAVEIYSLDVNGDDSTDMKDVLSLRKQIAHADA